MKTVWKYEIPIRDVSTINMPQGAEVLHVDEQQGVPTMWVLVDPKETRIVARHFRFVGTGHPIEDGYTENFVGSFLMRNGTLVFHIFEIS